MTNVGVGGREGGRGRREGEKEGGTVEGLRCTVYISFQLYGSV